MNPVLDGDHPDPSVLAEDGVWYLAQYTGNLYPGLSVYRSRDTVGWEYVTSPLTERVGPVSAPCLTKCGELCYLYFSARDRVCVTRAPRPEGPWEKPTELGLRFIDPFHFQDADGSRWLLLNGGYRVRLTPDGMAAAGAPERFIRFPKLPEEYNAEGEYPEAPKVLRVGDKLHLFYADGGTAGPATGHGVWEARAERLDGPWEFSPHGPILRTRQETDRWHSLGHGDVFAGPDGWRMLCHGYERGYRNQGRKLLCYRLVLGPDGWFRLAPDGGEEYPQKLPAADAPRPGALSVTDFFLRGGDTGWKQPDGWEEDRLRRAPGLLAARGRGQDPLMSRPWLFACGEKGIELTLRVTPRGDGWGGIGFFYPGKTFDAVALRGGSVVVWRGGEVCLREDLASPAAALRLCRIRNLLTFWVSEDGKRFRKLPTAVDLTSRETGALGGCAAAMPGVFACGEGETEFSDWNFTPLRVL